MYETLKAAVIGVGNMGQHHARIYSQLEGVDLVAVSDLNPRVGRDIAGRYGCDYFKDYKRMLVEKKPDVVSVAVPTSRHCQVALDVVGAGTNLLIEKPLAPSVEEGERIVSEARQAGVRLAVGHIERFNPAVVALKRMVSTEQRLGRIIAVSARRVGLFPSRIKDADVLVDLAIHDMDIFSYLLGEEPEKAFATSGRALAKERDDHGEILLSYPSGAVGIIQVNWITPVKIRSLSVTGTGGYADLDYINQKLKFYSSNYETEFDDFGDFIIKFGQPEIVDVGITFEEPLKLELDSFIQSVRWGQEPLVSGEVGLNAVKNIAMVLKFINSRRKR